MSRVKFRAVESAAYTQSAAYYDALYRSKPYQDEAQSIHKLIWQHRRSTGNKLLDVACGTGGHLVFLQEHYHATGLDLSPEMLQIALRRCPEVEFFEADMANFELGSPFDAIICLFGAIGYMRTVPRLQQAIRTMARHLKPGGVLVVEPWLTPDQVQNNTVRARYVDEPELKIARMSVVQVEGRISRFDEHHMIGTPQGIVQFVEHHELGLFSHDEYLDAFRATGLDVRHDPQGLVGRGLYIGLRAPE